ncbi:hypothetical protein FGO68_gene15082 [Halteria grandinella]|uniref:Uncharacterized protein n=1 Tax=Halteria grandinella TaxID=5974 RepID=A0A8J8T2X5_HALGN|nr:hypothetical protein FGO68_gene15082 [Halteria grandinella]
MLGSKCQVRTLSKWWSQLSPKRKAIFFIPGGVACNVLASTLIYEGGTSFLLKAQVDYSLGVKPAELMGCISLAMLLLLLAA